MAGQTTMIRQQTMISGFRPGGGRRSQRSESLQEVQRPLITPDEVMRLPAARKDAQGQVLEPGHLLVFVAGQAPIYGRQILYFRDPVTACVRRIQNYRPNGHQIQAFKIQLGIFICCDHLYVHVYRQSCRAN